MSHRTSFCKCTFLAQSQWKAEEKSKERTVIISLQTGNITAWKHWWKMNFALQWTLNCVFSLLFQKRAYKSYAKALPGLKKIGISSVLLRKIIGSLEVGCGVVLTLVPGKPKDVANFLLLLVMLAVLFFHQLVGDPLKRYAHALVFGILLTCRLLIARQGDERPEREDSREEQHINDQEKNKVKQS